jgi:hypothetical protein
MARIKIPYRFNEQVNLSELILKKHKKDGDKSILNNLLDMESFEKNVISASEHDALRDKLQRQAELETERRNNDWKDGDMNVRAIAQFLKSIYIRNPHELGEWGFTIDSSPQNKKKDSELK